MINENKIGNKHYEEIVEILKNSKQITTKEIEEKKYVVEKKEVKNESNIKKYAVTGAIIAALIWGANSLDLIGFLENGLENELNYNKEISKPYVEQMIENNEKNELEEDIKEFYEEENKSLKGGI